MSESGDGIGGNVDTVTDPAEMPGSRDQDTISAMDPRSVSWWRLLVATAARTLLLLTVSLLFWAAIPAAIGWIPTTVFSGSMMPRIVVGDVVIAKPVPFEELALGQVLLVADPDHPDRLRLHRFESVNDSGGLILRGDANPQADSSPVAAGAVRGVGVLRVPYIGLPVVWLSQGDVLPLGLSLVGVIALCLMTGLDRDRTSRPRGRHQAMVEHDQSVGSIKHLQHRRLRTLICAVLIISGVVVVALRSESAYAAQTSNTGDNFASIPYYTCSASVLAASPYYYWRLNDGALVIAADGSGNARLGTYLAGSINYGIASPCPRDNTKGITMNGSGTYITPSTLTVQNNPVNYTIAIWFKANTGAGGRLIGFSSANSGLSGSYDRMLYLTNAGQVVFGTYPGTVQTIATVVGKNDNQWHYAVATQSSTAGMALYLDGVQIGTKPLVTTAQNYSGYWRVGWDNLNTWPAQPSNYSLTGSLADAAVYQTALTPARSWRSTRPGSEPAGRPDLLGTTAGVSTPLDQRLGLDSARPTGWGLDFARPTGWGLDSARPTAGSRLRSANAGSGTETAGGPDLLAPSSAQQVAGV